MKSFYKTDDEAKVLAHQIVDTELRQWITGGQLSNPDDRSAVAKSNSLLDASVIGRLSILSLFLCQTTMLPRRGCQGSSSTG